jgi:predicted DNA-binding transcriptional regulator AlpA
MKKKSGFLNDSEAAEMIGVCARTLHRWRKNGEGPMVTRIGPKLVRYTKSDIAAWLESRRVTPQ